MNGVIALALGGKGETSPLNQNHKLVSCGDVGQES